MPEITSCPDCDKKLRVPDDLLGKTVRCPGCQTMFVAKADAPPPSRRAEVEDERPSRTDRVSQRRPPAVPARSRDDDDDRPRRRDRRDDYDDDYDDRPRRRGRDEEDDYDDRRRPADERRAWRGVRSGVNLAVMGSWLSIAALAVLVVGGGIMALVAWASVSSGGNAPQPGGGPPSGFLAAVGGFFILGVLVGMMGFASVILWFVGMGMCLQTPASRRDSTKGLGIAAFACACGALFLYLCGFGMQMARVQVGGMAGLIVGPLGLATFVLWVLFLRGVASRLRDPTLAGSLMTYLITVIIASGVSMVLSVVGFFIIGMSALAGARGNNPQGAMAGAGVGLPLMMVLWGVIALGSIGLHVWLIYLMKAVCDTIDRHVARRG